MPQSTEPTTPDPPAAFPETGGDIFGPVAQRTSRIVFWIAAYLAAIYIFLKVYQIISGDPAAPTTRIDFIVFWSAAKLALAGDALAAFNPDALAAAAGIPPDPPINLLWLYPPGFLILITPLGLLPYWAAWATFFAGSAICLALAVREPAQKLPGGWRLFVVAPVVLIGCLSIGQSSVLWTAALVSALWSMQRDKVVTAGFWIALLTLKPQLGLLIPVALIAGREWRVLASASGWATLLILASTVVFGVEYWKYFLAGLSVAASHVERGNMPIMAMSSIYGFVRAIDASHAVAIGTQFAASIAVAAIIAWIWSRKHAGNELRCAALCAAIPLATPYAFYYEMVVTLAAGLFLLRDGFGRGLLAKLWLLVIWFGPVPAMFLQSIASVAAITPLILLATTAICIVRVWRRERDALSGEARLAGNPPGSPPRVSLRP